nr:Wzt carbohydrate-binding domain-containing protein [Paludibacteraceae bacterium]
KAIGKMQDVSRGEGRTVLFVSHNMASMQQLCSSCVLLENGMISTIDKTNVVIDKYIREQSQKGNYERKGSGFLRFQSFSLTKDSIAIGENLELNLSLTTTEYIARAIIHINIYNDDEQYVLQASSEDSEFILTNLAPNATYHVKCVLPHLNAIPGNYSINLWVGTPYEWFDWLKGCLQFSIYQDQSYIKRVSPYPSDAKLVLQSEWKNL